MLLQLCFYTVVINSSNKSSIIATMGVGTSASSLSQHPGVTADVIQFCGAFEKLAENSDEGVAARTQGWRSIDNNGNGHVSLAEADSWIKSTLIHHYQKQKGEKLWKTFRRSYIRAFTDAADAGVDKGIKGMATATEDDFLERGEFRLFCAYLCLYSLMFDAFKFLDGSHASAAAHEPTVFAAVEAAANDHKISQEEWMAGCAQLAGSPFHILNECASNPEAALAAWPMMDADGKGSVLLVEFCEWIKAWEVQVDSPIGHVLDAGARDPSGRVIE
jgi:hypothetical protein